MKKESDILETLAGTAIAVVVIAALVKAFERAKETKVPIVVEENGALYEIAPDGTKKFVRQLPPRPNVNIPRKFTLS